MSAGVTAALIAAAVISAIAAGTSMYMQSKAAASQADQQRKMSKMQAEAERQAADARRRQVIYNAERARRSMLTRQAAAGVQIGEGSLLENMMDYASHAEYDAQLAAQPHFLAASVNQYQARLFGGAASSTRSMAGVSTGVTVARSLASSYRPLGDGGVDPKAYYQIGPDYGGMYY